MMPLTLTSMGERRGAVKMAAFVVGVWSLGKGGLFLLAAAARLSNLNEGVFAHSEVYGYVAIFPEWAWGLALAVPGLALFLHRGGRWAPWVLAVVHGVTFLGMLPAAPYSPAWIAALLSAVLCSIIISEREGTCR